MLVSVRFILVLTLWATFQTAASAVTINAGSTCTEWSKTRQAPYSIYEGYNEGFIVGTLNGMSIASGVSLWINQQIPISRDQVYSWMDDYCRKNPLSVLPEAIGVFANQISHNAYQQAVERAFQANH
jgi:hypothetical protein